MNRSTVFLSLLAGLAFLAPLAGAQPLPQDLPVDPAGIVVVDAQELRIRAEGHVEADVDDVTLRADGIRDIEPVSVSHATTNQAPAAAATPKGIMTAAAGTVVGVGLLALAWNYFKYGILAGLGGPLFSRIASHKILDNDVRSRVHEAIGENPGVTIKEITQLLGIGWGTAVYHLARLEQERLIVSERHRQFRRYFKNGGGIVNESKTAFAELKNPTTQRLAAEILHHPGSAQKDLCQTVGISAPLAHKHLGRLEAAQLLTKQREWKLVKYFPTDKLAELMPAGPAPLPILAA